MSFKISALAAAVVAIATVTAAPVASAAMQNVVGTNFDLSYDDSTLFGTARLIGNNIIFTPTNFAADSLDGAGLAHSFSTLDLTLTAHAGFDFGKLNLLERGDYRLIGAGSTAAVTGTFGAFGLADFSTEVKNDFSAGALTVASGSLTSWSASSSLALGSLDKSQGINVTLSNDLLGGTMVGSVGTEGFVEKKFAGGGVIIGVMPAVPEPETYALMLAGLGVIGMVANRRRQKR